MIARWRPLLLLSVLAVTALAACSERPHEPVKVIAAPRPEPPAALPPPASAPVLPVAAPPAASVAAAVPPRALPPTPASAPPQHRIEPGQPNGNAAFRAALEEKFRSRGQASAP